MIEGDSFHLVEDVDDEAPDGEVAELVYLDGQVVRILGEEEREPVPEPEPLDCEVTVERGHDDVPSAGWRDRSTTRVSPSWIQASTIESPLTGRRNGRAGWGPTTSSSEAWHSTSPSSGTGRPAGTRAAKRGARRAGRSVSGRTAVARRGRSQPKGGQLLNP